MTGLGAAFSVELLKARRSRVPWGIAAGFSLFPLVGGLFMLILKDPERARQLGLLGAKAQLAAGTADWPTFVALISQAVAIGGAMLFAFLFAWLFGREFADRTVRDLVACPTSRSAIVIAKIAVGSVWSGAIVAWVITLALRSGWRSTPSSDCQAGRAKSSCAASRGGRSRSHDDRPAVVHRLLRGGWSGLSPWPRVGRLRDLLRPDFRGPWLGCMVPVVGPRPRLRHGRPRCGGRFCRRRRDRRGHRVTRSLWRHAVVAASGPDRVVTAIAASSGSNPAPGPGPHSGNLS